MGDKKELKLPTTPTPDNPIELSENVFLYKKGTRFVFRFINEEYVVQLDQKILRKFINTIVEVLYPFFKDNPEYSKKFFSVLHLYLKNYDNLSEEIMKAIVAVLLEGFELIEQYLQNHPDITELKKPSDKNLQQYIDIDIIKHFVYFSWSMKLYSFFKFLVNYKIPDRVDKYIMNYLTNKHLVETGLSDVLLNIVKGKVISTIKSRGEMWKYLALSIRKSPDIYISQLYNYTILYILLFMKNAYNPIGYISNFIDRQIIYIFSDVYVNEVIYHDVDDHHIRHRDLIVQTVINKVTSQFLDTIYNFYSKDQVNKFMKEYVTNTNILNLLVYPMIKKLLFKDDPNIHIYFDHNNKILTLYMSILYSSSLFGFKYIPKLLTSNTIESKKVNYRKQIRETITINSLYNINLRNIDVLKEHQVFNSVINNLNNIYINLLTNKPFDFDLYEFIKEFSELLTILSNDQKLEEIKDILEHNNYMFKRVNPLEMLIKKKLSTKSKTNDDKGENNE